jgi:hypothetical protein
MRAAIAAGKNVSSSNLIKPVVTNQRRSNDRAPEFGHQTRRQSMFAKTVTMARAPPDSVTIEMESEPVKERRPSIS